MTDPGQVEAGRKLKALREATDAGPGRRTPYLTQTEVAKAAGIDEKVYNALERGRRPLSASYATRLAPILGDAVRDLVPQPLRYELNGPAQTVDARIVRLLPLLEENLPLLEGLVGLADEIAQIRRTQTQGARRLRALERRLDALFPPNEQEGKPRHLQHGAGDR